MRTLAIVALAASLTGCAAMNQAINGKPLTPEQKAARDAETARMRDEQTKREAKLAELRALPLRFVVAKDQAPDAWQRAQVWVAKHASVKLQNTTDVLIETFNPGMSGMAPQYGYKITKAPVPTGVEIDVQLLAPSAYWANRAPDNAPLAAHYIRTGESLYEDYIRK